MEGNVLSIISRGETYGYEILLVLNKYGFTDIYEGTLYPILTRMEKKSLISCRLGKSPLGPKRKYYTVTESGEKYYEEFKRIFKEIIAKTNEIISADNL
ncbi:PadR family transcriptional regulator [Clostridium vincentii]|uniref:Lineage-specific thermal regulator protein n=1 Tax=Clostridium vincentii TaxID=52704 RepID=A0A2T0BIW0_9CLOT|nr:PadR family transcriptional regulator [Clostridium vincentii]PRR83810.1 lineage-specific thermal regulator protein [Clostridium vincentii]